MTLREAIERATATGCTFWKRGTQYGESVVREYRMQPNGEAYGVAYPNRSPMSFKPADILADDWQCSDKEDR